MPVDQTIVARVAAEVMAQLEGRFGDDEDANIRAVFLIAVDGELHTEVRWGIKAGLPRHVRQTIPSGVNNTSRDASPKSYCLGMTVSARILDLIRLDVSGHRWSSHSSQA